MTRNRPVPNIKPEDAAFIRSLLMHEDDKVLVFNKPPGLAVQTAGGRGQSVDFLLWAFAKSNGKRPRLVHRIDSGTSGVLVVARTQPAAAHLSEQFAKRRAKKTYLALVSGQLPDADEGTIDTPLRKVPSDRGGREKMVPAEAGQKGALEAETGWRIRARAGVHALIEASPVTGRMHQIRAHLAALGCPILGDRIYGSGKLSAPRLMLHANRLEITHPDGEPMVLEAPPPEDFLQQAAALGLAF
ncbi:RluA family pseudouridine synthase [Henriciella mobilis]|uniref:RluA family pseudouridine synthase n=1 Tax=Henriciella mobilis TaxID=2305467 RepID=A0A399RRS4_9PROT|nr:RluA family pseudouridine synthase [Henriciella mobilis]RIJ32974.1 RluA family pseudouridine synthase [Henriciella mobilis]